MTGVPAAGAFTSLAGTFTATDELLAVADHLHDTIEHLLQGAQAAGAIREDVNATDIALLLSQVRAVRVADPERIPELRRRYLQLTLKPSAHPVQRHSPAPQPRTRSPAAGSAADRRAPPHSADHAS